MRTPDTLTIKEWAQKQAEELRESIRFHIANGIDKKQAVEMVLADSSEDLGAAGTVRDRRGGTFCERSRQ